MLRPATVDDADFLWAMLAFAASPDDPRPAEELAAVPQLAGYVAGWGRAGDVGLIAVDDATGELVGAGWYRAFTADAPGYGFVDEATPEVAIACTAAARGQGLGHRIIGGLLARAHADGLDRLCLSVHVTNAVGQRVYEDEGFVAVGLDDEGQHITMVAPTRPAVPADQAVTVRSVPPGALDRDALPPSEWGTVVARLGELLDLDDLPTLVAEIDGRPAGLLTWRHDPTSHEVEVVGIEAWTRDRGVGAALLRTVRAQARALGVRRLWLITNNDNLDAMRFYQRRGWRLARIHPGEADRSRERKPSIPLLGDHGIPVHDEVELELRLP